MGKVISLDRGITWDEFMAALRATDVNERVVATLNKTRKTDKIGQYAFGFGHSKAVYDEGCMYTPVGNGLVATHENFPQYLLQKAGLDRHTSLELAAASVIAYSWTDSQARRAPYIQNRFSVFAQKRVGGIQRPELWQSAYCMNNQQTLYAAVYRFASRIALQSLDMDALPTEYTAPQPPHIAALADPMPVAAMRQALAVLVD